MTAGVRASSACLGNIAQTAGLDTWPAAGHNHGSHRTNFMRTALDRLECVQTGGLHGVAAHLDRSQQ